MSLAPAHPNFVRVDKPKDVDDLIRRSGVNFQVRLCRLFVADFNGVPSTQISAPKFVACDFDGVPIDGRSGPLTFGRNIKNGWKIFGQENFLDDDAFEYFEINGLFALDEPDSLPITFNEVSGTNYRLADYYKCKSGSTRATVAFDSSGQSFLLGKVGSRYTVIQNTLLAEDAFAFMESTDPFLQTRRSVDVSAGGTVNFFGIELAAGVNLELDNVKMSNLSHSIFLFHTHDTKLAYNHFWYVRDLELDNQPIIHIHRITVKHTKNIKRSATRITDTLAAIKGEYRLLFKDSEKLKVVEVGSFDEARKFLELVELGTKKKETLKVEDDVNDDDSKSKGIDGWLVDKIAKHFLEVVAPKRGFNLWSLYLALCDLDGDYWDERIDESGLFRLFKGTAAFKKRKLSRQQWVEWVDNVKIQ